jgi:hypothetical protein
MKTTSFACSSATRRVSISMRVSVDLVNAVPLPAALPLLAGSLGGLGLLGWWRRRKEAMGIV